VAVHHPNILVGLLSLRLNQRREDIEPIQLHVCLAGTEVKVIVAVLLIQFSSSNEVVKVERVKAANASSR
jgi:hypothetical protein